jgi:hypothetical protein
MRAPERRNFDQLDDTRTLLDASVDFIDVAGDVIRRFTLPPGWRWPKDVESIAKTPPPCADHHG